MSEQDKYPFVDHGVRHMMLGVVGVLDVTPFAAIQLHRRQVSDEQMKRFEGYWVIPP